MGAKNTFLRIQNLSILVSLAACSPVLLFVCPSIRLSVRYRYRYRYRYRCRYRYRYRYRYRCVTVTVTVTVTVDMHMFVLLSVNRSVYSLVFPIFKYCPSVCQSICKFSKEVTTVTCLIWPNLYCLNRFSLYCLIHFFKGNRYMYLIQSNSNYNQNIFFNISYSIKIKP